jgi:hypothetical protein
MSLALWRSLQSVIAKESVPNTRPAPWDVKEVSALKLLSNDKLNTPTPVKCSMICFSEFAPAVPTTPTILFDITKHPGRYISTAPLISTTTTLILDINLLSVETVLHGTLDSGV